MARRRPSETNHNGVIELQEISDALKTLGVNMDPVTISNLIHLIDQDNDGQMNLEEFAHFVYMLEHSDPRDVKTILFYAADRNYTQTIDQSELASIFKKLNIKIARSDLRRIQKEVADTKDGSITFENFKKLFLTLLAPGQQ